MKNEYLSAALVLLLVLPGCTSLEEPERGEPSREPDSSTKPGSAQISGQARGRGMGKGQGLRAVGRKRTNHGSRRQRGWDFEPVVLTDSERESVQIETVEASYRPLKAELSTIGQVVAPPQTKAIVSYHEINPIISLFAPIAGKIVEADAVLGAMIDQSTEILTIMNSRLLRVDAEIYEKDIARIQVGRPVEVRVQAYPREVFRGRLQYISDIFKEDTRTITVHTEVENTDYRLKPGMFIVSSKLELIAGRLPMGTSPPILGPVSSRMGEVFEFAVVGGETDPMELRSTADWTIRYRLQGVRGISFVINLGGFIKQFQVLLKPEMLRKYNITIRDVKEAIENSNRNFSGGVIRSGAQEVLIKGLGRLETLEHIQYTVITSRNNVPVYVRDVADVQVGAKFRREAGSHNGNEAVYVTVEKQYGGDTLEGIANIKSTLARIAADLPPGVDIKPFYDQSILILKSLEHVRGFHHRGRGSDCAGDDLLHVEPDDFLDCFLDHPHLDPGCPGAHGPVRRRPDRDVHRWTGHRHRQDGQWLHHHGGEYLPSAQREEGRGSDSGADL